MKNSGGSIQSSRAISSPSPPAAALSSGPAVALDPEKEADESGNARDETSRADGTISEVASGRRIEVEDPGATEARLPGVDEVSIPSVDVNAQAIEMQRRGMGAGEAVEHVRIKHLATSRYLCVDEYRPCDDDGSGEARDGLPQGESDGSDGSHRVSVVAIGRCAQVPSSAVFVLRPRPVIKQGGSTFGSDAGILGPDDLVHLQHRDTGLFLSALPHRKNSGGVKEWGEGSVGSRVGLTVVKSPLTSEVSVYADAALAGGGML